MKKLLLGLGTIAAVTAPVVSAVACSSKDEKANSYLDGGLTLDKVELIGHYVHVTSEFDNTKVDDMDYIEQIDTIDRSYMTDISYIKSMIKNIKQCQAKKTVAVRTGEHYSSSNGGSYIDDYLYKKPTGDAIIQIIYTSGKIVRKSLDSLVDYLMYINDISNVDLQQWETGWT